ncbi:hypothetical protein IFR05_013098 [Cadophora sp. M221]|nr:hypothetical protein IFR05_013098 [Cadophora sp. M221]
MERPPRPPRNTLSFALRSGKVRDISKQLQKLVFKTAWKIDPEAPVAEQPEIPQPTRRSSLRQALRDGFERIRLVKPASRKLRSKQPPPGASPHRIMNLFQQQAARNNGGPVRQPQPVIDLTSDDEDDEDDFYEEAPEHLVKRERLEVGGHYGHEPIERMGAVGHAEQPRSPVFAPENGFARPQDIWGDYDLDDAFDDEAVAAALDFDQQYAIHPAPPGRPAHAAPAPPVAPPIQEDILEEIMETRIECVDTILNVFPGICRDYVSELYDSVSRSSERLIAHILDKMDKGSSYPNAKEKLKKLKRKRDVDEDVEAARKYGAPDRIMPTNVGGIRSFIAKILSIEFPLTSMNYINTTLSHTGYRLFSAYEVLEEAQRTWSRSKAPYQRLKNPRKSDDYTDHKVADYLASPADVDGFIDREKVEVFEELQAARRIRSKADARRAAERAAEIEEEENVTKAEAEGTMSECECCCCEYPLNRMVHCNAENEHWFCRGCAKRTAEVEIGKSKYELHCMSTEKCSAGFSLDQRAQFLDDNTRVALERNEQESNLRLAGIENLESCPFCPFAAEYPPVEVDREFRCQAPDCEKISCRLCKLESHIPKSCEENAKENGLSIRRQIEEAMSAAMIRKCNKCGTPFVKEEGCNKMTCTRNGCRNIQCYVCSKSCDYNHFNDPSRGGKAGNCPLFESVEQRHDEEVKKAEKEALEKVLADHPEYSEEDLKVKMSENVKKDDEKRKSMDPRVRLEAMRIAVGRPGLRAAMNFMELRPMMPHPPAMRRREHDLPDFPQLLHEPPAYIDPIDPIYGDLAVGMIGRDDMPRYPGYIRNLQQVPLRARGIDGGEVIIQDPRLRPQRPRPHHPHVVPPAYNQREINLQRIGPQAIPPPRVNDPAAPNNIDLLDDFYDQWQAEVQQRQRNDLPAPAQPRVPAVDPVPNSDAGQNADLARARLIFLANGQTQLPPHLLAQPVARPNAVQVSEPPRAPLDVNARQRMRIRLCRPDRPENAEDIREQEEADALQTRIDQIREARAAREARHAEHDGNARNANVELRALAFQDMRRQRGARAALEADIMQGVARDVPAPENNAQPAGARLQENVNRRLQDLNVAIRRQRDLQEQNGAPGNNAMRDADRDMVAGSPSPSPSPSHSEDDAVASLQVGDRMEEFMRDIDVPPGRPARAIEMDRLLRDRDRRRNDERRAEQELANLQQDLQRVRALANAAHPLPPNQYPGANPWIGVNDYQGPEQVRMRQHLEQVARANAPVHQNPNQNPGANQNLNQQPAQIVDYNQQIHHPMNFFDPHERNAMPFYQPVRMNLHNMHEAADDINQAFVQLEAAGAAEGQQQLYLAYIHQDQAQARARAQLAAQGQAMAQGQADFLPIPPPPLGNHMRGSVPRFVAGREANPAAQRARLAVARARAAVGDAFGRAPGEHPGDQIRRLDDAMRNFGEMRERMEGRIAEPVHVPEVVEEEYESDAGSGEEEV